MASSHQNLSSKATKEKLQHASDMRVGVIVASWNNQITDKLLEGALSTLLKAGCPKENIVVKKVPGALELPLGAQLMLENCDIDGVVVLGCVIRGGTPHFDYVCSGATKGVMDIQLSWSTPVAFGLLTVDDMEQALDRAGGKYGNKGDEAAATLIDMITLKHELEDDYFENVDFDFDLTVDDERDFMDIMVQNKKKPQLS